MTSIHRTSDDGLVAYTKGASHEVLTKSTSLLLSDQYVKLDENTKNTIERQIDDFAAQGFRVLALAIRVLPDELKEFTSETVEKDLVFLGLAALFDPPRPNIESAVKEARHAGMRVIMVTGDHELTAEAIAERVGIITSPDHLVVSGYELNRLPDDELSKVLDKQEILFARTTPEQKLRIVRALRAKGETVAVTGDG